LESIKRRWRQFEFICEEALASITRSMWMSWMVVITMAVSLSILGGFWLLAEDLNSLAHSVGSKVEIMVFLKDDAPPNATAQAIRGMNGVADVSLITRDQAWQDLQADMKSELKFENLIDNPLPNTLRVKMANPDETPVLADQISKLTGVEDIKYGRELLAKIQQIAGFTQLLGLVITGLLFTGTLAVIGNTIRLAVQNRRREIEIMQLVGASQGFIHWPFLLEGCFFGFAGALLTCGVLFGWRTFVTTRLQGLFPFLPIMSSNMETLRVAGYLAAIGMSVGALGSLLSVMRHMHPKST
jgi:cell division transport system permease protein